MRRVHEPATLTRRRAGDGNDAGRVDGGDEAALSVCEGRGYGEDLRERAVGSIGDGARGGGGGC